MDLSKGQQGTRQGNAMRFSGGGRSGWWLRALLALGLFIGMALPAAAQVVVSPTTTPDATFGQPYNQAFTATGGLLPPYTFAVTAGVLPAGLSLTSGGVLSGTPAAAGSFPFTVTATDVYGTSGSRAYTLLVNPPTITVAPTTLPDGQAGSSYSQTISASGGTAPYSFAVSAGALPAGLSLGAGGALSGTPTVAGSFNFTVTATDVNGFTGNQNYVLAINAPTIILAPTFLPDGIVGGVYEDPNTNAPISFSATGGAAPYTFYVDSGIFPPGLNLDATTGTITGTPTTAGIYNFDIGVDDLNGFGSIVPFTVTISAPPTVTPNTLPNGQVGNAYTQTFNATGPGAPYTFSISSGALPPGLNLTPAGNLSGTPTAAGNYNFNLDVSDVNGIGFIFSYSLQITPPAITLTPATLPDGQSGSTYSQTLTASGGTAPYSFAVTAGALPTGLSLAAGGALTGTPTATGSFTFTVTATDAGGFTGTQNYTLLINAPVTITVAPATLPNGQPGTVYSQTFTASGGAGPYSFDDIVVAVGGSGPTSSTNTLPPWLSLSASGVLSGTPPTAGSFLFVVRAIDANGFAGSRTYTLVVNAAAITLTPATLPDGQAGSAYNQTISASGGTGPYTFAVTAGALPAGLSLATGGALSGTPTATGSFNFTVTATDSGGSSGTQTYTLLVTAPTITITLTPSTLPDGRADTPYNQSLSASGGTGPYSFAVTSGALPAGLTLATSGALTGTPTATGSVNFTVTATDAGGFTGIRNYTLLIDARPDPTTDPDVNGLISAQAATTRHFATAQIINFHDRLERLHVAPEDDWGFWFGGALRTGDRDPHGNASALSFETQGISAGIDYNFSQNFAIGLGGGYGRDRTHVGRFGSRSDAHAPSAVSYMSWHPDSPFFIDGLVAYQHLSFDLRRMAPAAGSALSAGREGKQKFTSWSGGYEHRSDNSLWAVYSRIDAANAELDGYTEHGDPIHALQYGTQDVRSRTSTLGLRYKSSKDTQWGEWERRVRLEFLHDFHDQNGVSIIYADTPSGPQFHTLPAGLDRSRIVLELGSLLETTWGVNLRVDYRGVFGGYNGREHWLRFSFDED